jgi:hypothetical protein
MEDCAPCGWLIDGAVEAGSCLEVPAALSNEEGSSIPIGSEDESTVLQLRAIREHQHFKAFSNIRFEEQMQTKRSVSSDSHGQLFFGGFNIAHVEWTQMT